MNQPATSQAESDARIVLRVQRGDVQAYGELVAQYERGALAAVLPVIGDLHEAQDVVQDIFVRCYLKLGKLRDGGRFGGWMLKIARREAARASKRRRRDQVSLMRMTEAGERRSEDSGGIFDDEARRLLESVRRLPAHERVVVGMRFFDGRSVEEIARSTGRPVGTVTKQLSRAIARLRKEFEAEVLPCRMKTSAEH